MELSKGFFYFMFKQTVPSNYHPVFQVVTYRNLTDSIRFRVFDGCFRFSNVFISNERIVGNVFEPGVVFRVNKYEISTCNGKLTLSIVDYEVIAKQPVLDQYLTINQVDYERYDEYVHENRLKLESPTLNASSGPIEPPNKRQKVTPYQPLDTTTESEMSTSSKTIGNVTTTTLDNTGVSRKSNQSTRISNDSITPISALSPYITKWRICGVCTNREPSRVVSGKKGQLKVFSFELADENGDCIKVTCWDNLVDQLDNYINVNETYYIFGDACVRSKNSRFNGTSHDFEISLNNHCIVEKSTGKQIPMPKFSMKRTRIADIPRFSQNNQNRPVDVLAVIDNISEPSNIFSAKKNVELLKRDIILVDESNASIVFTLWEESAQDLPFKKGQVVGIKGLKVSEFNGGFTLGKNMNGAFRIEVNPDLPEVTQLANWYPNRHIDGIISISSASTGPVNLENDLRALLVVDQTNMADSAKDGKGVIFYTVGLIVEALKENNITYPACVVCNKKVILSENSGFDCTKCGIRGGARFKQKFLLTIRISDISGDAYITLFDEAATELLGKTAAEMDYLHKSNHEEYQSAFQFLMFKTYLFKLKVTSEFYNDKKRTRFNCLAVRQINYPSYSRVLDIAINRLEKL